ncbi:hypothetical protein BABINDRAFT_160873 [Babjeviella inositovora NRRL Y-12698]|uniref:GST N-terminal domain-containing protein n=1 Tax=Babjeviella inositovora NRRL Y-12698 TaxID=984486 RepID=A0A1E3QSJ9_9ASCO|nr:uncharacterized protein BABINDRAFT_160873 [Babjeviella inositovora NRRL Y-12698]ODQ80618.1 hypothetical protein BABINDRAFT_160873 [Babjeviella inositovora NRRL Y-12698]
MSHLQAADTTDKLVLWDLNSKLPQPQWSPNTMKVRSVLNFRCIPFVTKFVTYMDFPGMLEQAGGKPWPDAPHYTLPAISHKGCIVMGSDEIVEYLEKEFTLEPSVFFSIDALAESKALNRMAPSVYKATAGIVGAFTYNILLESDLQCYRDIYSRFQIDITQILKDPEAIQEQWTVAQKFLNEFEGFTSKDFTPQQLSCLKSGEYLFGNHCSYADLHYFSLVFWAVTSYQQYSGGKTELITDGWLRGWYDRMSIYKV